MRLRHITMSRIQHLSTLIVFFTAGWWWRPRWIFKYPDWLVDDRLTYLRYGFFPFVVLAILAWALTGFRGLKQMASSGNLLWATFLILLGAWARFSYGADTLKPDVALSGASQFAFVIAFALSLLCNAPPKSWILGALTAGMVFLAVIAIGQSAIQGNIQIRLIDDELGLGLYIRELTLDPAESGVSVVQSEGVRFLRPYGLTAHPNMLAGVLVMGLYAGFFWWLQERKLAAGLIVIGLWALLLTFSRAAIGGLGVGLGVLFGLWILSRWRLSVGADVKAGGRRTRITGSLPAETHGASPCVTSAPTKNAVSALIRTFLLITLTLLIFVPLYFPFLGTRTGLLSEGGSASLEQRSTAARAVYTEQAWELLKTHQWRGVGIGNFAWHSAYLLHNDWRDLRGDHVHNIYLLVLVELGIIGLLLYLETLIGGAFLILGRAWRGTLSLESICLFAGVAAWLAIGWFDHYPVTQMGYQLLFWGSFAAALNQKQQ